MAYGIVHKFPGGTSDQYEASVAAVHPSNGSLPEGQLFHAAGPSEDGNWTISVASPGVSFGLLMPHRRPPSSSRQ